MTEPFKLSESELNKVIDSLDDTGGYLVKASELRYWIEHFTNHQHENEPADEVGKTGLPQCSECGAVEYGGECDSCGHTM